MNFVPKNSFSSVSAFVCGCVLPVWQWRFFSRAIFIHRRRCCRLLVCHTMPPPSNDSFVFQMIVSCVVHDYVVSAIAACLTYHSSALHTPPLMHRRAFYLVISSKILRRIQTHRIICAYSVRLYRTRYTPINAITTAAVAASAAVVFVIIKSDLVIPHANMKHPFEAISIAYLFPLSRHL